MHHQHARSMISDVTLVTEDGEVVAAGTHDQMYSFFEHHVEDGEYLIFEGDKALKLSRTDGIVWPVATATIE